MDENIKTGQFQEDKQAVIPKKPFDKLIIAKLKSHSLFLPVAFISIFSLGLFIGISAFHSSSQKKTNENSSVSQPKTNNNIMPNLSPTPTQPPISIAMRSLPPVSGWKTYQFAYGDYQFDYPSNWIVSNCPSGVGVFNCLNINVQDKPGYYGDGMITIGDSEPNDKVGNVIKFNVYGLTYRVAINSDVFNSHGYTLDGAKEIFQRISSSISPLNQNSTCSSPALIPLRTFPDNFSLSTYRDSDGMDPVNTSWPYTISFNNNNSPLTSSDTNRGFIVNYIKEGLPFDDSTAFSSTVTPIIGTGNAEGGFEKNSTSIWHINCIDTQKDGPGVTQPYYVKSDYKNQNQPFAIDLYGKVSNPTALWGQAKWNTNLLKQTRDTVYIKQIGQWQKYTAVGYFATMPTAYGGKPAIYLYPKSKESIKVEIHPNGDLIETDHLYEKSISGWKVTADSSGRINDALNYLYYEALVVYPQPNSGYVVSYNNLFTFSKDYVKELGLTSNEADEFIAFWKTKLKEAPYYFVSNLNQQEINDLYPLKITPKPDSLLRVELYFRPLDEKIFVPLPERVIPVARKGFTAVEWGAIYSP